METCATLLMGILTLLMSTSSFLSPAMSMPHNNMTDLSALLAFKAQVDDLNGVLATNWTTTTPFCSWIGVSCNPRKQRVTSLSLQGLSLGGTIPQPIANLSFLSLLDLSNNSFHGFIPGSLGRLPRLRILVLQENQLSGPIPPAIFNMSSLTTLALYQNNLSGLPLPTNFTLKLPLLQWISLSDNHFIGEIPSSFARCHELQMLSLSGNKFTGTIPAEFAGLTQLAQLYLGGNQLTGTIPAALGNLTNLQSLDLSMNNLQGVIHVKLGNLRSLEDLNLNLNALTGPIPDSLSNASMLQLVSLGGNSLTGPVPVTLGNMPKLKYLILTQNRLQGGLDFIASLTQCRALEYLEFGSNELHGPLPVSVVGNLSTQLLKFVANTNHLTGRIPAGFGNLTSLLLLRLSFNELTGPIPADLTRLERLQGLILDYNRITGSIPSELGKLTSLTALGFTSNALSGSIPDSVGNISGLQTLYLDANTLSSAIPESIWRLGNLIELNLAINSLDGSLPQWMGNLKIMTFLDLSSNGLSGSIPSAIGDIQMLEFLDLSHNSFQGHIPLSFGRLINIKDMNLSSNSLSGAIPKSLANLRYLTHLNLSFNRLEGQIPDGGPFSNLTIQSLTGNTGLCGASSLGFPPCSTNGATLSRPKTRHHLLKYILPVVASSVLVAACFCLTSALIQMRTKRKRDANNTPSPINIMLHPNERRFVSYHEIVRATDNFHEANILGKGSFGSVFKGCLDDGLVVAIKVLNLETNGASESFDAECRALRMVRHRNLVKIISSCSNLDFRAMVLQYMPNGSLDTWLYSDNRRLTLIQRINIMFDVASALEYLHDHHVVHCDLKPGNVLMDEDMTAHVGDFGIAKLLLGDNSAVSASMAGTIGYMAPEYGSTGKVSRKGDVYSYGILLLEILTKKKPTDPMFDGESCLRQWISVDYHNRVMEVVDQSLLGDESGDWSPDLCCLLSAIELGLLCSRKLPAERISMKDIVPRLRKIKMEYLSNLPDARSI